MHQRRIAVHPLRVIGCLHPQKPQRRYLKVPGQPSSHRGRQVVIARAEPGHRAALDAQTSREFSRTEPKRREEGVAKEVAGMWSHWIKLVGASETAGPLPLLRPDRLNKSLVRLE